MDETATLHLKCKDSSDNDAEPVNLSRKVLPKCFLYFTVNRDLEENLIKDSWCSKNQKEPGESVGIHPKFQAPLLSFFYPSYKHFILYIATNEANAFSPVDVFYFLSWYYKKHSTIFRPSND